MNALSVPYFDPYIECKRLFFKGKGSSCQGPNYKVKSIN